MRFEPPYFIVSFSSELIAGVEQDYRDVAQRMEKLASEQPGFLGVTSVRDPSGVGITLSYWKDLESIEAWKNNSQHLEAQRLGKKRFYKWFRVEISRCERTQ